MWDTLLIGLAIGIFIYFIINYNKKLKQQKTLGWKLISAIYTWDNSKVEKLLEEWVYVNFKNEFWSTALMLAAGQYNGYMVELLLKYWANPEIPEKDWTTPLMQAVANDDEKMVKILLEYWANPNTPGQYWSTAISWAANNKKIAKLLLEYSK